MCHEMAGGTPVVIIFSRGGKEMKKRILALALVFHKLANQLVPALLLAILLLTMKGFARHSGAQP